MPPVVESALHVATVPGFANFKGILKHGNLVFDAADRQGHGQAPLTPRLGSSRSDFNSAAWLATLAKPDSLQCLGTAKQERLPGSLIERRQLNKAVRSTGVSWARHSGWIRVMVARATCSVSAASTLTATSSPTAPCAGSLESSRRRVGLAERRGLYAGSIELFHRGDLAAVQQGRDLFWIQGAGRPVRVEDERGAPGHFEQLLECLALIDSIRDDYGYPESEARHPDIRSGLPWPLLAPAA